jgi:hypothetical protein
MVPALHADNAAIIKILICRSITNGFLTQKSCAVALRRKLLGRDKSASAFTKA